MADPSKNVTLADRVRAAAADALELHCVHLGARLGLYEALAAADAVTAAELAELSGVAPRAVREWLEQQAIAGYLTVDDVSTAPAERRYALPEEHVGPLADVVAADHVAPVADMVVGVATMLDEVTAGFRTGAGVRRERYPTTFRAGRGAANRPWFARALVREWLPAASGVVEHLRAGGRLLDVGCGLGWSTQAVADAFPAAEVIGVDDDVASIVDARRLADEHANGARFEAMDVARLTDLGRFDAALVLDALHELGDPCAALVAVRAAVADRGPVIVAQPTVSEDFVAPGDLPDRLRYGWSLAHCLPVSMASDGSAALGGVLRPSTVAWLAAEAGFERCDPLDVGGRFTVFQLR